MAKICEGCGYSFEDSFNFCPSCGRAVPKNEHNININLKFPNKLSRIDLIKMLAPDKKHGLKPNGFGSQRIHYKLELTGIDLSGLDLSKMDLSYVNFTNVNLSNANLSRTTIKNSQFIRCDLTNTNFSKSEFTAFDADDFYMFNTCNLYRANFSHCYFQGITFYECNLSLSDFRHAYINFMQTDVYDSILRGFVPPTTCNVQGMKMNNIAGHFSIWVKEWDLIDHGCNSFRDIHRKDIGVFTNIHSLFLEEREDNH